MSKVRYRSGGVMRISDFYLSEVVQLSGWVMKQTGPSHREHRRAIGLLKRIKRFVYGTDRLEKINRLINEDRNRGVLFQD